MDLYLISRAWGAFYMNESYRCDVGMVWCETGSSWWQGGGWLKVWRRYGEGM